MKLLFKSRLSIRNWKSLIAGGAIAFTALLMLTLTSVAAADLPEPYQPQHWQQSGPGTKTVTPSSGPTDSIVFGYDLRNAPFSWQTWSFTNPVAATANVTFNWNYHCMHSWFAAQARLYVFADGPSGRTQITLYDAYTYGDATATGSRTIHVNQGYNWGFIIQGTNFDSSKILLGNLTISSVNVVKELTLTGITADKVYDGTNKTEIQVADPGLIGVDSGNDVTLVMSNPGGMFNDRNVGVGKLVTVSGLSLGGLDAGSYYLNSAMSADITALPVTVTAISDTKVYDGTASSSGTPTLSVALAAGDTTHSFVQTFDNRNSGAVKSLTPSGMVNDGNSGRNYSYTFISAMGEITKLPLTVSAVADSKMYDGTTLSSVIPALSGGLAAGDVTHSFTQAFVNRNAGTGKMLVPAGAVYDGNNGDNYHVTFSSSATGEILKLPITISAVPDTKIYDGTTTSAHVSTLSVPLIPTDSPSFKQTFDNRDTGVGKTLIPSGVVTDGNGGGNYDITFVPSTVGEIKKLPIMVSAVSDWKTYDGTGFSSAMPSVSRGLAQGDLSDSFGQQFGDKNVGSQKTIFAYGRVIDGNNGDNYSYTYQNDTNGRIDKISIVVTAVQESKVYDGTNVSSATPKTS